MPTDKELAQVELDKIKAAASQSVAAGEAMFALVPEDAPEPPPVGTVEIEVPYSSLAWFGFYVEADKSVTVTDTHANGTQWKVPENWAAHFVWGDYTKSYAELIELADVQPGPPYDDDEPEPEPELAKLSLEPVAVSALEGEQGFRYRVRLRLSKPLPSPARVKWGTRDTGTNPANAADFGGRMPAATAIFRAGETVAEVSFAAVNDAAEEPNETFEFYVEEPSPLIALGEVTAAAMTIINDDGEPDPGPEPEPGAYQVVIEFPQARRRRGRPRRSSLTFNEVPGEPFRGCLPWDTYTNLTIAVVKGADPDFTLFFLRGGPEDAIGFHYGKARGTNNEGPYTVKIFRDGQLVATEAAPFHTHYGFWSWPLTHSWPRIAPSRAEVIAQGYMRPFNPAGVKFDALSSTTFTYSIMGSAGLETYMPQTGERPDIGPVTNYCAEYFYFDHAKAEVTMKAQAAAAGSMPVMILDDDNRIMRLAAHPLISMDSREIPDQDEYLPPIDSEWSVDVAHQPTCNYVPYLMYCHPFDLLKMQALAMRNHMAAIVSSRGEERGVFGYYGGPWAGPATGQARAFAWASKQTFYAAICTPTNPPAPFVDVSDFTTLLDYNRQWVEAGRIDDTYKDQLFPYIENGRTMGDFASPDVPNADASWETMFCLMVFGHYAKKFPEWRRVYDYFMVLAHCLCDEGEGKFAGVGLVKAGVPYRLVEMSSMTTPPWPWTQIADTAWKSAGSPPSLPAGDRTYDTYLATVLTADKEWFGNNASGAQRDALVSRLGAINAGFRRKYPG